MEFTGVITNIGEKEVINENFSKIAVRLEEGGDVQYPASVSIDFANKMLWEAEALKVGDEITVHFNLRSNESKKEAGRFFNGINAWRVEKWAVKATDEELPF